MACSQLVAPLWKPGRVEQRPHPREVAEMTNAAVMVSRKVKASPSGPDCRRASPMRRIEKNHHGQQPTGRARTKRAPIGGELGPVSRVAQLSTAPTPDAVSAG